MNKPDLLSSFTNSRAALLAAIDDLTDMEMIEPGVEGEWSVKDILAHLTAWEAEMVKLLVRARSIKHPAYLSLTDSLNDQFYAENKDRPLDRILADFHGVRKHIIRQLDGYTEKELNTPDLFKWLEGKPLWQWISDEALNHEAEHAGKIKQWHERMRTPNPYENPLDSDDPEN